MKTLFNVTEVTNMIRAGRKLLLAGDDLLLSQLPRGNWVGGTNPYFATGAGGMLQAVLNGFGGLDITDAGIVQLKTKLPKKWKSLTIKGVGPQLKTVQVR